MLIDLSLCSYSLGYGNFNNNRAHFRLHITHGRDPPMSNRIGSRHSYVQHIHEVEAENSPLQGLLPEWML